MAARSKAWVCCRSFAGIAGSNPAGGMEVFSLVNIVCCQVEVSASSWSLVQKSPTDCGVSDSVWSWILANVEALAHWGVLRLGKNKYTPALYKEWRVSLLVKMCIIVDLYTFFFLTSFYTGVPDGGCVDRNIFALMKNKLVLSLPNLWSTVFFCLICSPLPLRSIRTSSTFGVTNVCLSQVSFAWECAFCIYVRWWYTCVVHVIVSVSFPTSSFSWNFHSSHERNFRNFGWLYLAFGLK